MAHKLALKQTTLTFVFRQQPHAGAREVLLAMKKRGFGVGKWNGPGGKVEKTDASVEAAARRETLEEVGLDALDLKPRGTLVFYFASNPAWDMCVHVFVGHSWTGDAVETEEMKPQWYKDTELPFDSMWEDDRVWLPELLKSETMQLDYSFWFDKDMKLSRWERHDL